MDTKALCCTCYKPHSKRRILHCEGPRSIPVNEKLSKRREKRLSIHFHFESPNPSQVNLRLPQRKDSLPLTAGTRVIVPSGNIHLVFSGSPEYSAAQLPSAPRPSSPRPMSGRLSSKLSSSESERMGRVQLWAEEVERERTDPLFYGSEMFSLLSCS